ncbi:alkaline phosphatase PhoX [Methylotenera sp.]|uniref:alkaline phosphatase PhoX n=1 Tax=Methylotenera sp. TaxID=2051956 RepID=UPI0027317FAF|nr:alkaline phosphatase PhoX [Methylotenera sp.]MDP2071013.1 DUF839 domain-containing protein [Methylotenera sp.]MDP3005887.1 DUF839 domain-containing protein [Methylotenera sp.]
MKTMTKCLAVLLVFCCIPAVAGDAYIQPATVGWEVRPIITVGESAANGYRMVGVPDGLGAHDNDDGSFTLLMNHEIAADKGVIRAHGQKGAFVSRWVIDAETLAVRSGADLVQNTVPAGLAFNRLCSADLAPQSAFFNAASGKGYAERLFLNGEEDKAGGQAFAHALNGTSYALPDLGRIAWENVLANAHTGDTTLVIGMDDIHDGLVLTYVGEKRAQGNPVEQAGLVGGRLYAIKAEGARFDLVELGDAAKLDGKALRAQAAKLGAKLFARPEDGAWNTQNANIFYFTTTDKVGGNTQLHRLQFDDVKQPTLGGRIEVVLNGRDIGAEMFDNLTVDDAGNVLIQEDPGKDARLAAIWQFDPVRKTALKLFESRPALFLSGQAQFMTEDEEHSGIVEITPMLKKASWFDVNRRYYLGTTQSHLEHADAELVEHGQLWLITSSATASKH